MFKIPAPGVVLCLWKSLPLLQGTGDVLFPPLVAFTHMTIPPPPLSRAPLILEVSFFLWPGKRGITLLHGAQLCSCNTVVFFGGRARTCIRQRLLQLTLGFLKTKAACYQAMHVSLCMLRGTVFFRSFLRRMQIPSKEKHTVHAQRTLTFDFSCKKVARGKSVASGSFSDPHQNSFCH